MTFSTLSPAMKKMVRARIKLITLQPFFGVLALRLKLVEDDTLKPPTMCTDGKVIRFHPDWVNNHDAAVCEAAVAHEVGHCALQHMSRRQGRAPKRWNYAIDYATNDMLADCGFTIPPDWLYNPAFKGMSAEHIYSLLPEDEDGEDGNNDGPFDGHQDSTATQSPAEVQETAEEWQVATIQAAEAQKTKMQGNLPGTLKRFIDSLTAPKADWRTVLRNFMKAQAKDDFAWQRPSRKALALGYVLPGLHSEAMEDMTCVIDTSGSITQEILNSFGAEIADIRESVKPNMLRNMYCDAEVNHVDEFTPGDDFKVEPHGGGGTDFRPPFRWLEDQDITPTCLAYLTDGYGTFPKEPPPYPVLWVMTTDVQPPWGDVVRIEL